MDRDALQAETRALFESSAGVDEARKRLAFAVWELGGDVERSIRFVELAATVLGAQLGRAPAPGGRRGISADELTEATAARCRAAIAARARVRELLDAADRSDQAAIVLCRTRDLVFASGA